MVLNDTEYQQKHLHINQLLAEVEKVQSWCQYHEEQNKLLGVNDWDKQQGQTMSPEKLEKLLLKLSPDFRFEHVINPNGNKTVFKRLFWKDQYIMLYHDFDMPEFSWFNTREEEVFDPSLLPKRTPGSLGHIERKDLPKSEIKVNPDGSMESVFDPNEPRPGYRLVKKPWNEKVRGWRTVLRRLVEKGYVRLEDVERLVPSDNNRASWAIMRNSSLASELMI